MKHYSWRLLFVLTILVMALGLPWPSIPQLLAQEPTPLTGQLVGRDKQPIPAQVTIRITSLQDSLSNSFDTSPDGSFSYTGHLEPGTYWLAVEYDSLPDVLRAILRVGDLASTRIILPTSEPILLNLLGDRTGTAACADIPLVFGTPSESPVETYRQVVYTLLALLEIDDLYYEEAYNPLSRSSLAVQTVYVDRNQHAIVMLGGEFAQNEEPCDDVYSREQIEQTVLSIPAISGVTLFVNNQLLDLLMINRQYWMP